MSSGENAFGGVLVAALMWWWASYVGLSQEQWVYGLWVPAWQIAAWTSAFALILVAVWLVSACDRSGRPK